MAFRRYQNEAAQVLYPVPRHWREERKNQTSNRSAIAPHAEERERTFLRHSLLGRQRWPDRSVSESHGRGCPSGQLKVDRAVSKADKDSFWWCILQDLGVSARC